MSKILYWHVKLFQHHQASHIMAGSGINKVQVFEGYATGKPRFRPGAEFVIELFTTPGTLETMSIRTCGIDSMVCTPVFEDQSVSPSHGEMQEYIKAAIGEGYQPEHEAAITDLSVIDALSDNDLNREYGKCWQWYNMGGGMPFTPPPRKAFELAAEPLMKYLAENHNPHTTAIVNPTEAELVTGEMSHCTDKFLKD